MDSVHAVGEFKTVIVQEKVVSQENIAQICQNPELSRELSAENYSFSQIQQPAG